MNESEARAAGEKCRVMVQHFVEEFTLSQSAQYDGTYSTRSSAADNMYDYYRDGERAPALRWDTIAARWGAMFNEVLRLDWNMTHTAERNAP